MKSIPENAPDIILQLDLDGHVHYVNKLQLGYVMEKVIGHNWLLGLSEESLPVSRWRSRC